MRERWPDALRLQLLGNPTLTSPDGRIRALEPRAAALLALVAVEGEVSRARAAEMVWPESAQPRVALRQQLSRFRRAFGVDLLVGSDRLQLASHIETDLCGGTARAPLLGDLRLHDQPEFDAWLLRQRAREGSYNAPDLAADPGLKRAAPPTQSAGYRESALPATLLRPPRLIGREREVEALARSWDEGCVALLLGEPGMGKSRLLAEFTAGWRVVVTQARAGDAGVPYAALARLLRAVLELAGEIPAAVDRTQLARLLPEIAPGASLPAAADRLAVQTVVAALLRGFRIDGAPLAGLIVDDLHFADEASVEMLQALAADDNLPRFAFSQRPGEGGAAVAVLRDALDEGGLLATVTLAPLTATQVADLLTSLAIDGLDVDALAPPLTRHTGGNPLFILETLKLGLPGGWLRAGRLPAPSSVGALIERRLQQLPERALALARVAAVAGSDFDAELAQHAIGVPAVQLTDAWALLESAQVLSGAAFAHDLVYEAVLRMIPTSVATQLHAQVAAWLAARSGEPARIAAHWAAAGAHAPAAAAWMAAGKAADQRVRYRESMLAFERAAALFEALGEAEAHYGARLAATDQAALLQLPVADYAACVERLVAAAPDATRRAEALVYRLRVCEIGGDSAGLIAGADELLALARQAGLALLQSYAHMGRGTALANLGRESEAVVDFEQMAALGASLRNAEVEGAGHAARGSVLVRLGRIDEGLAAFAIARPLFERGNNLLRLMVLDQQMAVVLSGQGRAGAALATAERALLLAERLEPTIDVQVLLWLARVMPLRQLGRYAEALALLEQQLPGVAASGSWVSARFRLEMAQLYVDLGRADRAHQQLVAAQAVPGSPQAERDRALAIELQLRALRPARGEPLPPPLGAQAEPRRRCAVLRALAALVPAEQRLPLLDRAFDLARDTGLADEVHAVGALRAHALAAVGRVAEAVSAMRAALPPADIVPAGYPPTLFVAAAEVLAAGGEADAAHAALGRALNWLGEAVHGLPAELRSSLLERNDANRRLLQAAQRDPQLALGATRLLQRSPI